jgi:outer membrane receptor protein involved in Fe transport
MRTSVHAIVIILFYLTALEAATKTGVVQDATGATVSNAEVKIGIAGGALLSTVRTDSEGRFHWPAVRQGYCEVRIRAAGFAMRESIVACQPDDPALFTLDPESIITRVTVSATRGGAEEAATSAHVGFVKTGDELIERPMATIGSALEQEPGILVQQSTYAQVSPFLRGLTGYQVLNLVDGIRFNNSTFRSGPNQYLAFVEPTQAQRVEALLGPTGAQYGSDSLGGTIHVITQPPRFATGRHWETHGDLFLGGATADLSGIGSGRVSIANDRVFLMGGLSGRRHNDLRAGGGYDSRNVFHRLFGMPFDAVNDLTGSRQQDSGFRQYGIQSKVAARLGADQLLTIHYMRGVQDQVRGYKDLLGGLGRLQSQFEPQTLNWLYGRYEKVGAGFLDSLSGTFSFNSQTDGGIRQNLRDTDPITRDLNRVDAYGYSSQGTTHWGRRTLISFGGDIYDEHIDSSREVFNPANGSVSTPRPLYPDNSRYGNVGLFGQSSIDVTHSLRAAGALRLTGVRFETQPDVAFGIPASSQWFRDLTFHTSLRWQIAPVIGVHGLVSRGFRAPNLNDLGALGLNDLGYEIPSSDAVPAGALLATDAGESAMSKGVRLASLRPESLMNYEFGVRVKTRRMYFRVQVFDAELYDPIVRRTLLFPIAVIPSQLAGLAVAPLPQTATQRMQNVVAVATELDPRAVKAFVNDGRSRFNGIESLVQYVFSRRWSMEANYSYLAGRELNPNRSIRRLPPQMGVAKIRYTPSGQRPWFEVSLVAAGAQERLSGGDIDDERIGASRRRRDIADFFAGTRVRPFVDHTTGAFLPTGETLLEIQNRVLPLGAVINGVRVADDSTRVPLYTSTAGWATLSLGGGIPIGERWQAIGALENILDRNSRFHGSGIDAPGRSAYAGLSYRF